ncbi:MAG: nucleoside transporter C-terminal domain-containing protein [Peptostreptococcaceae bacterium]
MKIINILGIILVLGCLYLFSTNREKVDKTMILKAVVFNVAIAFLLLKFEPGRAVLKSISDFVTIVLGYGTEGLAFVFGPLADGGEVFIFAIQVLGNIIFISALVGGLFYLGVIGFVVKTIGGFVGKILGTSKVESFVAVANMFLGQTESPILVSKYLSKMTESEIMLVLISGMGSMSATVLMGYASMGIPMEYLLIGGALVPFGSIVVSKILMPEEDLKESQNLDNSLTDNSDDVTIDNKGNNENLIAAISQGSIDGLNMALGIGASLIAITSIVALLNGGLSMVGLSLETILSYVFAPMGFLMGLPMNDVLFASELLGTKLVLNEFVAFGVLGEVIGNLDYRSGLMMAISLTGFANIASMGICISGISVFCPDKRNLLSRLAFKGMVGGFVVSFLSCLVVGLFV